MQVDSRTGDSYISLAGTRPMTTRIVLRDNDNSLAALSWHGYRLDIRWGWNTSSGNKYAGETVAGQGHPPTFVYSVRRISKPGEILLELYCISLWELLNLKVINTASGVASQGWIRTAKLRYILMYAIGDLFPAKVWQFTAVGSVFVDETSDASSTTVESDVALLPAVPAVGDITYIGSLTKFDRVSVRLNAGTSSQIIVWEYWNGAAWVSFTSNGIVGGSLTTSDWVAANIGHLLIFFEAPTDWATTAINGSTLYYIRGRVTTAGTGQPLASLITLGLDIGVTNDAAEASAVAMGLDDLPFITTNADTLDLDLIRIIIDNTLIGIRVRYDGLHLIYTDPADVSTVYTYDNSISHWFDDYTFEVERIIPNRYTYVNFFFDTGIVQFSGVANDTNSQTAFGVLEDIIANPTITSNAMAAIHAQRRIDREIRDAASGLIVARMNVGQEINDRVSIVDARLAATFTGRISKITRAWASGMYHMEIDLGGAATLSASQAGWDFVLEAEDEIYRASKEFVGIPAPPIVPDIYAPEDDYRASQDFIGKPIPGVGTGAGGNITQIGRRLFNTPTIFSPWEREP
jgi:hypothetical protein